MPIRKIKLETFSPEVAEIYNRFRRLPKAEHIAKPPTLQALFEICKTHELKRVLELGGGLGTISRLLLEFSRTQIDIYEHDPYFQEQLRHNLSDFSGRYQIIPDYRMLPPQREYDLVVIDGGHDRKDVDERGGFNVAVWFYINYLRSARFVYVEGKRHIQRLWARKALCKRFIYTLDRFADTKHEGLPVSGGVLIKVKAPSGSFMRRIINFIFWELVEGTSVRNYLLFRIQKLRRLLK